MASNSAEILHKGFETLQHLDAKIALISTEWNYEINQKLIAGAKEIFSSCKNIELVEFEVPGAVEIPFAINQCIENEIADAYIAFGCVIKGATPHFEYVCKILTDSIALLNVDENEPIIFGVLTVNNEEEAFERLGGKHGHKGKEAAMAALKMIDFYRKINDL
ncbi:MAG: 6,7-dimethyl-8-ribityllumazine synthase [Chitinophagaceae bacterium]|nr:6,7-dimethyl-8-ribityllumazine synthase [Chitinophagaceae bacterium]